MSETLSKPLGTEHLQLAAREVVIPREEATASRGTAGKQLHRAKGQPRRSDISALHSAVPQRQTKPPSSTRTHSVYLLATVRFLLQSLLDFLRNVESKHGAGAQMQSQLESVCSGHFKAALVRQVFLLLLALQTCWFQTGISFLLRFCTPLKPHTHITALRTLSHRNWRCKWSTWVAVWF